MACLPDLWHSKCMLTIGRLECSANGWEVNKGVNTRLRVRRPKVRPPAGTSLLCVLGQATQALWLHFLPLQNRVIYLSIVAKSKGFKIRQTWAGVSALLITSHVP